LGVYMDDKTRYGRPIEVLKVILSRFYEMSYRLKEHLNLKAARNIYYSCIFSCVKYCICIWGGKLQLTQIANNVVRLHLKIIRNLFSKFANEGGCLFTKFKISKLEDTHLFYVSLYMFRILKINEFPTLQSDLNLKYRDHSHSYRYRNNLVVPFPAVNTVKINYKYQFVKIWNDLPNELNCNSSLRKFKRMLTSYVVGTSEWLFVSLLEYMCSIYIAGCTIVRLSTVIRLMSLASFNDIILRPCICAICWVTVGDLTQSHIAIHLTVYFYSISFFFITAQKPLACNQALVTSIVFFF